MYGFLVQGKCGMIGLDLGHKCYLSAALSDMHLERWLDSYVLSDLQNVIEEWHQPCQLLAQ